MATYTVCIGIGMTSGPLLLQLVDVRQSAAFYMPAILVLLSLVPAALLPAQVGHATNADVEPENADDGPNVLTFAWLAPIISACFVLIGIKDVVQFNFLPVYALSSGLTVEQGLFLLSLAPLGGMTAPLLFGALADRFGISDVLSASFVLFGVLFAMLDVVIEDAWSRHVVVFLLGGVGAGIYGLTMALIQKQFSTKHLSVCYASAEIYWGLGAIMGTSSVGAILDLVEPTALPVLMAAAFVPFGILVYATKGKVR